MIKPSFSILSVFFFACIIIISATNLKAQTGSIDFAGLSSASVNSNPGLSITGSNITLEAWIYPTLFAINYFDGTIMGKDGGANSGYVLRAGGAGRLSFVIGVTGGIWVDLASANNVLVLNKWQHVAGVYDGLQMRIFVDGVQVASTPETRAITSNTLPLRIGASPISNPLITRFFTGRIDGARIWNVARSVAQLKQNQFRDLGATTGLIASYSMSDGSGTNITDISGNGNTAALTAGAIWTSSPIQFSGNALNFDGVNDVVTVPDNATIQLTNALTIETWVYATSTSLVQNVIAKSSQVVNQGYIFPRTDNGWNTVTLYLYIGGGWRTLSAPFPSRNAWHHLAATYDGANMRIYINGLPVSSVAQTGNVVVNSNALTFGNQPGYTEYFTGSADDIRIWNVARTPAQILADMNRELDPTLQPGLVGYYTANQGIATSDNSGLTTLPDLAGTNNGTLSGFALTGPASNFVSQVPTLVVPVTWRSFTVQSAGEKKALLKWTTATEQNTRDFLIQRSNNGTEWENLSSVKAAGNSNQIMSYEFIDAAMLPGRNFYRLQQRDLDNRSSYSVVKTLEANASEKNFIILENPVKNNRLNVQVNRDNTSFSLVNSNGVVVWKKVYSTGVNNIYLSNLSKGVYLLRAGAQIERVVIQ